MTFTPLQFYPGKGSLPVLVVWKTGCAPEPVWTLLTRPRPCLQRSSLKLLTASSAMPRTTSFHLARTVALSLCVNSSRILLSQEIQTHLSSVPDSLCLPTGSCEGIEFSICSFSSSHLLFCEPWRRRRVWHDRQARPRDFRFAGFGIIHMW